jgi:hypothetical protein
MEPGLRPDPTAPPTSLESAVRESRDVSQALRARAAALQRAPLAPALAADAIDLAQALEMAEPDLGHAIATYLFGWKADRSRLDALRRARSLALQTGDMAGAAKMARLEHQQTREVSLLVTEANSWVDAAEPHHALRVLQEAAQRLPEDRDVAFLIAAGKRDAFIPAEISSLEREGAAAPDRVLAGERLLHAARLARMSGADDVACERLLQRAFEADPMNDTALALLEDLLIERGNAHGLVRIYKARAALAPDRAVDVLRRAGTKLVLGRKNPGLGIQLVGTGLDRAYREQILPIHGHIAMIVLLREYSQSARVERDFLTMLALGLTVAHAPVEEMALAVIGLEVAWSRLRDPQLAHPYAALLARLTDGHPSLDAYHEEGGIERAVAPQRAAPTAPAETEPAPAAEPWRHLPDSAREAPPPPEAPVIDLDLADMDVDMDVDLDDVVAETPSVPTGPLVPMPDAPRAPAGAVAGIAARPTFAVRPAARALPAAIIPVAALATLRSVPLRPTSVPPPQPVSEFRLSQRLNVAADIRARVLPTGRTFATITRDVSEAGIFVLTDLPLEIGHQVELSVDIPAVEDFALDSFELVGRIVRTGDTGYGIELIDPPAAFRARVRELAEPVT